MLVASVWTWVQVGSRWAAGQPAIPGEPRRPVPWGPLGLLLGGGLYLLLPAVAASAILRLNGVAGPASLDQLEPALQMRILVAAALASLLAAGISAAGVALYSGCTARDLGWDPRRIASDLRLGAGAFCLLAPPVYLIQIALVQWIPSEHPLIELMERERDLRWLLAAGVVAVVAAPLVEEFYFRLLLQGWLEKLAGGVRASEDREFGPQPTVGEAEGGASGPSRPTEVLVDAAPAGAAGNPYAPPAESPPPGLAERPPPRWPIAVSALLFAGMHWNHGPDPIPLFVLALGLGYLYRQTHRLLPCVVVHLLLNLATLMALAVHLFG